MTQPCQRWRARRDTYRPAGEPIDVSRYGVDLVDEKAAKAFVCGHHYSASYPAAQVRIGLYRAGAGLVGVAVFSVPMQPASLAVHCRVPPAAGVELGRFVLLDDVPANGETWFLARAFAALARERPQLRAVLAYSDPIPRQAADGRLVMPGHVGTIYQAFNGRHVGRSSPRTLTLAGDGTVVSDRALSKIRNEECGAGYAIDQLVRLGAPRPMSLEDPRAYVTRALAGEAFRRVKHPGNLAYVWPVGASRRHPDLPAAWPYPKRGIA